MNFTMGCEFIPCRLDWSYLNAVQSSVWYFHGYIVCLPFSTRFCSWGESGFILRCRCDNCKSVSQVQMSRSSTILPDSVYEQFCTCKLLLSLVFTDNVIFDMAFSLFLYHYQFVKIIVDPSLTKRQNIAKSLMCPFLVLVL